MKPVQASASACWNDHFSWQRLFNARALRWKLHEIATSAISLPIIYDCKIRSKQNDCVRVNLVAIFSQNIPCNSPNCLKHRSTQCPQPAQQEPHRRCLQLRQLQPGRNGSPRRLAPNRLSLGLGASLRYSLHWCPFEMFKLLFKYNRFQMDLYKWC